MNKLSLVRMQLPETYKENFDDSSEGLSKGRNSPYIFQVVASLPTKACSLHGLYYNLQLYGL
jgi:hypothetical protein